jgi:hypothetical protein
MQIWKSDRATVWVHLDRRRGLVAGGGAFRRGSARRVGNRSETTQKIVDSG